MELWHFVFLLGAVLAADAVKNATAAGYGGGGAAYYPPLPPPAYYYPPPVFATNTHMCALDVGYGIYGGRRHRSNRPREQTCDDVLMLPSAKNKGIKTKNCNKCCKMTAQLNGFTQNDVLGMILVFDQRPRCVCCAPILPLANSAPATQPATGY